MKDLPSGHLGPHKSPLPSFPAQLPLTCPFSRTSILWCLPPSPWPSPCPLALPPFEQHPSTNALLHLIMGTHQKLQWEGVPTLLLAPL